MSPLCFRKLIVLTSLNLWIAMAAPVFCQDQPTAIPSIVLKFRDQLYVADYSSQLDIYEVANSAVGGGRRTFCFLPHPVLDSASLHDDIQKLRNSLSDAQKKTQLLRMRFPSTGHIN